MELGINNVQYFIEIVLIKSIEIKPIATHFRLLINHLTLLYFTLLYLFCFASHCCDKQNKWNSSNCWFSFFSVLKLFILLCMFLYRALMKLGVALFEFVFLCLFSYIFYFFIDWLCFYWLIIIYLFLYIYIFVCLFVYLLFRNFHLAREKKKEKTNRQKQL